MSTYVLRQGISQMASRQLFHRPYAPHFGIMRPMKFTHRIHRLNLLHAPFRSTHTLPRRHFPSSYSPLLWLLAPLGGGIFMYSRETPPSISAILSSPNIIPKGTPPQLIRIDSPYESQTSLLSQLQEFIHSRIWEPIRTGFRFLHLLSIFIPVILTAPMILVGPHEERYGGDRWGAVWWYGLLVKAMQRAGPTFIKVNRNKAILCPMHVTLIHIFSYRNGLDHERTCFQLSFVISWAHYTPMANPIVSHIQNA
jgi:hypothetical protein